MIRKALIGVLTIAAVSTGTLGAVVGSGYLKDFTLFDVEPPLGIGDQMLWWTADMPDGIWVNYFYVADDPATSRHLYSPLVCYLSGGQKLLDTALYVRHYAIFVHIVVLLVCSLIFATYPTLAFIRGPMRRHRRRKRGLCIPCGYDLRGNESGVCPECGKPT